MTVTTAVYQPFVTPYVEGTDTYAFELEIIGPDAFELWYLDANDNRTRASTDRYTVVFTGNPPIFDSGEVTLTQDPPEGTTRLSMERNTPITQLADFNNVEPFPMRMVEFVLDKATMICQEIAYRKCETVVGTEMTQLISFDPYTPFYASEVNFALDKLILILNEIDSTAEDCRDRPEEA